jgi:hypothetical protein
MKSSNPDRRRSKLSFAVDRSEIDISSDWVQSIMCPPRKTSLPRTAPAEKTATVEASPSVAGSTTVEHLATEPENATDELFDDIYATTVADSGTVANIATVADSATGVQNASVARSSTVAVFSKPSLRALRLRPIRRITDGLTSGQFTVYTLMYDNGEILDAGQGSRLYRGGYADLCRLSGLSKRGVQNVVGELLQKGAIAIHQAPGYHKTQTSVYAILCEQALLASWLNRGLCYAAGKGKRLVNPATVDFNSTVGGFTEEAAGEAGGRKAPGTLHSRSESPD